MSVDPYRSFLWEMVKAHTKLLRTHNLRHCEMLPVAERLVGYLKELKEHDSEAKGAEL